MRAKACSTSPAEPAISQGYLPRGSGPREWSCTPTSMERCCPRVATSCWTSGSCCRRSSAMPRRCRSRHAGSTWSPSRSACATSRARTSRWQRCAVCSSPAAQPSCSSSPASPRRWRPRTTGTASTCCRVLASSSPSDEASYRYLAESIRVHPDQETLKQMMQDAGFDAVDYHNLTAGVVAVHVGRVH